MAIDAEEVEILTKDIEASARFKRERWDASYNGTGFSFLALVPAGLQGTDILSHLRERAAEYLYQCRIASSGSGPCMDATD